jgi:hypothetical protein
MLIRIVEHGSGELDLLLYALRQLLDFFFAQTRAERSGQARRGAPRRRHEAVELAQEDRLLETIILR